MGGLTQDIAIPTWKWGDVDIHFIVRLPRTQRQYDSIWVIVERLIKSAKFIPIKSTYLVEEYAKLYINEIVRMYRSPLPII